MPNSGPAHLSHSSYPRITSTTISRRGPPAKGPLLLSPPPIGVVYTLSERTSLDAFGFGRYVNHPSVNQWAELPSPNHTHSSHYTYSFLVAARRGNGSAMDPEMCSCHSVGWKGHVESLPVETLATARLSSRCRGWTQVTQRSKSFHYSDSFMPTSPSSSSSPSF